MKTLEGKVISKKMAKTATVLIEGKKISPLYGVRRRQFKKYQVDDRLGVKINDRVKIVSCRPVSKLKRWKVVEVLINDSVA